MKEYKKTNSFFFGVGNSGNLKIENAENINFTNCRINPKPMPIIEYKRLKMFVITAKTPTGRIKNQKFHIFRQ